MKYMGSKNRISKYILPIILRDRKDDQWYVEPFVGGGNMFDKVTGKRIASDNDRYVIEALKMIRDNPNVIPDIITEDEYVEYKTSNDMAMKGFVGYAMSFGGKWFGGYRRDVAGTKGCIENMKTQTRRSKAAAFKQSPLLKGAGIITSSYLNLTIPPKSIIYCDPPYANTTKYKDGGFDHVEFWDWCRKKKAEGHTVFISEYNAPDDFTCVWKKDQVTSLAKSSKTKKAVEKLFTLI